MPFTTPDLSTRIETERLYLRAYQHGDGRWYHVMALRNRGHLQKFEAGNAVMGIRNEEDAERIMREFVVDWLEGRAFFLGVFRRDSEEFVAQTYVGVHNSDLPEFEVGYFVDTDHEGQGYVSEAVTAVLSWLFRRLGAHRVRLECDDTNERSIRVAQRCGFVREGHIRENHLWPDGSITGTLHYGLLRTEHPNDPRASRARANTQGMLRLRSKHACPAPGPLSLSNKEDAMRRVRISPSATVQSCNRTSWKNP